MAEPAPIYDPEQDSTRGVYDQDADRPAIKPKLRALEGGGEGSGVPQGKLSAVPKDSGDKSSTPGTLKQAESSAASPKTSQKSESLAGQGKSANESSFDYHEEGGRSRLLFGMRGGKSKGKFKSKTTKRLLLGLGAAGGVGLFGVILIVLFFIGSLLIPNLAQHITEYQFARVTRQFAENAQRATDEKLALDAASDSAVSDLEKESSTTGVKALLSKLDKYSPSKTIGKLQANNGLKFNYKTTVTGRKQLIGITLDDTTYLPVKQGASRFVPGLKDIIKFKNDITLSKNVAPAIDTALRDTDVGMIVRSSTEKDIRQQLGISLVAWTVGKYQGKDAAQARLQEEKDKVQTIDSDEEPDVPKTDSVKNAENDAKAAEEAALSSDSTLQSAINNGGVLQSVKSAVSSALAKSPLDTALKFANPVYGVAMPVCIVYDGSMEKSGPTINNQTRQQEAAYYYLASASSQQQYGSPDVNAEAIGALNDDLNSSGDIAQSNPEVRSSGGTVDTSVTPSAEASAGGEFTLANVLFGGTVGSVVNALADHTCPTLTNTASAVGLTFVNIGVAILSGGDSEAAEESAQQTAERAISDEVTGNLFSRLVAKTGTITRRAGNLLYDTGKSAGKIAAATVFAKMVVMSRAGQMNSGFAQGVDLADEADAGGNITANGASQSQNFGRPLTKSEVSQSNQADTQYLADQASKESPYQRYFAFSNADSLFSRLGMDLYGTVYSKSIFSSIFTSMGKIFNPVDLISGIFGDNRAAAAANSNDDNSEYGNVQFGWSQSEENLIDSSDSYLPIENQQALDDAAPINGQNAENFIAQKYAPCFGYTADSNGNLTLSGDAQIGDLLSSGKIVRDSDGNVISNQGLCSPQNLGPNNPQYGDLVFRWRLAMSYNNTIDELSQIGNTGS